MRRKRGRISSDRSKWATVKRAVIDREPTRISWALDRRYL